MADTESVTAAITSQLAEVSVMHLYTDTLHHVLQVTSAILHLS